MGKYDAWRPFFRELDKGGAVPLDVLEAALGAPLPPVAHKEAAFWANTACASSAWKEYGWYAHPRLREGVVVFDHSPGLRGRPRKNEALRIGEERRQDSVLHKPKIEACPPRKERLVLVGCVAQKQARPAPAKDLYTSTLWNKRRRYAESTGQRWGILSAEYGLVDADTIIEPYDRYMGSQPKDYRVQWSRATADQVIRRCRELGFRTVEVHAGAAYLENGLIEQLNRADIRVFWPLKGMRIGEQLSWYGRAVGGTEPRQASVAVRRPPAQPARPEAPRLVSLQLIGAFDYRWPNAVEHFDYGWEGDVEFEGRRVRVRHGVGHRVVYSADRIHTVTWLDGSPTVEGVAADDYEESKALLSLVKRDDGSMVREPGDVPAGYRSFTIVDHRSEIDERYSRRGLAVKIRVDDVPAWAHHALLRRSVGRTAENPTRVASAVRSRDRNVDRPRTSPGPYQPLGSEVKAAVARRLIEFGESEAAGLLAGADPQFTPDAEANAFLLSDPFAFLIAVICDYQIKAERAWETPYLLAQRLGHLDPERILAEPGRVFQAFEQRPALHRYVHTVPEYILKATRIVVDRFGGDAAQIWADHPSAAQLQRRLREFPGISQKKAAMAVEMLERDFNIPITDMQGSDVALDVHVRRVFLRTGLAERDDVQHIIDAARALNPQRPSALDPPAWIVGRTWCRPRNPNCAECALGDVCPKLIERGDAVRGA
ncbi:endonuclease III [bacterium BMS3Bbin01]|nr:endonuclease III [bacterium BMS3Bbin01]